MHTLSRLLAVLTLLVAKSRTITFRSNESLLTEELLSKYGPTSTRPVRLQSDVCRVYMRYIIANVISLDELNQKMTVGGWLKISWVDEFLKWDKSEADVKTLHIDVQQIWHPDITLYNSVDVGKLKPVKSELASTVYPDGTVHWSSPAIFTSSCIMNVRYFPFDTQMCHLEFGSWSYEGHEIQIDLIQGEEASQTEFAENGVWNLENVTVQVQMRTAPGAHDFSTVKMYLILKRRYEFYVSTLLIPCVLLSFMSTFVYLLPPDSGEKISYGMTLVLSLLVFQELISESLPPVADGSPILSYYFTFVITIGCIAMVVTSVVLNIYCGKSDRPPPRWLESLLLGKIAYYIGRYRRKNRKNLTKSLAANDHNYLKEIASLNQIEKEGNATEIELATLNTNEEASATHLHTLEQFDKSISEYLHDDNRTKWEHISVVVDRLFFILSSVIVLAASLSMMIMIYLQ